ncbi:uncharacterized protein LOC129596529 [Paramacrobiotus metropolitanus]|uniref:uncharacterized protein LOC129596529 n=1 Tax=Paramacrobiotus metropolitanus TaxID=2943436 RepID=UPI00244578ED|nr:uncharacterized protein LOC129596529 [Paramacrobiotus metropolitanus]
MGNSVLFHNLVAIAFSLFLVYPAGTNALEYQKVSPLKAKCDHSVYLQCPNKHQTSAGTLNHSPLPNEFCEITLKTNGFCGKYGTEYAIYVNIRKSNLPENAIMEIYDLRPEKSLAKSWGGGELSSETGSGSVGQVRSSYARQPELSIEYTPPRTNAISPEYGVTFDYILVDRQNNSYVSPCYALDGYIHSEYLCDNTDNRINCPANYKDAVHAMKPASGPQDNCVSASMDGGVIAGIVIGCVFFVFIVVGIAMVILR